MQGELRNSGIDVAGNLLWGTHFCQFYNTKEDLIDIVAPYLRAGLEGNEFCIWVTCEALPLAEVQEAIRKVVDNFDEYLRRGQIEIVPYNEWYLSQGVFNGDLVLAGWVSKLEQALARDYSGLRIIGDTSWLESDNWYAFSELEAKVNKAIANYKMIALCPYCIGKCDAAAVTSVIQNHHFALVKQEGTWAIVTSAIYRQGKESLLDSPRRLSHAQAIAHTGSWHLDIRSNQLLFSDETHRIFGIPSGTPMTYETFLSSVHPEDRDYVHRKWTAALRGEPYDHIEHRIIVGDATKWVCETAELEFDPQGFLKGGFGTVQDITERRNMQDALHVSEEKFRIVSDFTHDWEYWRSPDNRFIYVSPSCLRFTGYTNTDFMNDFSLYLSLIHPDDRERVQKHMREDIHQHEPFEIEFRIIRRDGQERWISHVCQQVLDEDGNPLGRRASNRDITERKRMENELRIKDSAVASAVIGIAIASLDGTITYANSACLRMWGYENEEEILGKHITEFFADKSRAGADIEELSEKGGWQGEVKARRRDGTTFDVHLSASLVNDADGEPCRMMASLVDITEIKRIQEVLKEEKQIRYTIMENSGAHLAYLDREFNFIMANSAYAEDFGYAKEELVGKNYFAVFPDLKNEKTLFNQVRDIGERVLYHDKPFELEGEPGTGMSYWDWMLTPVKDSSGKVQGLVLSLIDTTARKKLVDLKDSLIGMVSHELRTPLTVISGCISTILTEWERLSSSELQQLLQDALLESESMSHLVENLLELSRFQAQRLALYEEPTHVKALIKETITKVKRQAPSHRFIISIPEGLQLINVDPLRIERILYNLMENAAKYSPPRSQIKVSARAEPERLVISVRDRGRGLSPSEQARIFGAFERLEDSRPDRAKGAGLGLLVCKRLVEAHGGQIWLDSKIGKGSTFYFSLPYLKGSHPHQAGSETG
jgi:PAS domain S-box-containing protein